MVASDHHVKTHQVIQAFYLVRPVVNEDIECPLDGVLRDLLLPLLKERDRGDDESRFGRSRLRICRRLIFDHCRYHLHSLRFWSGIDLSGERLLGE